MACHWIKAPECPGGKCWIPDCWGGLYGPEGCYCERPTKADLDVKIEKLEKKVDGLTVKIEQILSKL